jgi:hypothetical protein
MGFGSCRIGPVRSLLPFVFIAVLAFPVWGQGLDLTPSNPTGMPGTTAGLPQGSNSLYLSSGMFKDILPPISNLEIGYLYQFGNVISTGRLTFDYVLPAYPASDSAAFGEAHAEFTNFGKIIQRLFSSGDTTTRERGYRDRIDLSLGGGYRKIIRDTLLLGVNGFADTTKVADQWYGSGGVGFEMAALGAGNDLVELNFNFYGNLFQGRNSIVNAFRNGPGNYDASVAYSVQLGADGPDLRLKWTGYRFDIGTAQYGSTADAELKSKNGVFSVKAGVGHDAVNGWYHTVGGFVNVGVQFSKIFSGESPFTAPEPLFKSPRNLRRLLSRKVDRHYVSPPANAAKSGVSAIAGGPLCTTKCDNIPQGDVVAQYVILANETVTGLDCFDDIGSFNLPEGYYKAFISRDGSSGHLTVSIFKHTNCTGKEIHIGGVFENDEYRCPANRFHVGSSFSGPQSIGLIGDGGPASAGCVVITIITVPAPV